MASNGTCRSCMEEAGSRFKVNNPEAANLSARRWRASNPDYQPPYDVKEYKAAWHQSNRDRIKLKASARYLANRSQFIRRSAEWTAANPEESRAHKRQWAKDNPDQTRVDNARRRFRLRAGGGSHTAAEVKALFARQHGKCACCRKSIRTGYHSDHIHPLVLGGSNRITNIQLLCQPCNQSKGGKHPIEFMQSRGLLL